MIAADIMIDPFPSLTEEATLGEAGTALAARGAEVLAIRSGGHIVGTLSCRDLIFGCFGKGRGLGGPVA
jgi:CBS domain-containing protein